MNLASWVIILAIFCEMAVLTLSGTSLLKTLWEKEKLLVRSNFSSSHSVFYQFGDLPAIFIKFEICCLQTLSVWKSKTCLLGKG